MHPTKHTTNCTELLHCPKCGEGDNFEIQIPVWKRLSDMGTGDEVEHYDNHWDDDTLLECGNCHHAGTVGKFTHQWSGEEVPAVGDRITVRINSMGRGTVRGHFIKDGYLGVLVLLDHAPDWFIDNCKAAAAYVEPWMREDGFDLCGVFGAEIGPIEHEVLSEAALA